ncbi:chemotaxis-specific protein-glutamate methyltransferase CheB [Natrinema longum]|uniref:Protein-glutamate methylesterase/protein-glutamine glutaminase n=1 Tax=Natrinema longum TaxID=370324 RepID=A0A8A2UA78_9EURY|nr:chemotaxis-specific protein-glutamate methyltransferase CheB [Natrinema longum]MBZ6493856.1 chemotaxis-specific protein-glutamate methyltransferase CheB [Natrinema longum]QSW84808.1 chemotaxis-specific protein-glutamate methyltransferase CheB [Natrinema longum]
MTRVLVVDDSKFMRTVIGNALEAADYDVETAANGSDAVDAVAAFDPDVVTMDVEMPELDGIDAVERIMATNPTVILMLSVHTEQGAEATLDALERGAVDFLHKPDGSDSRNIAHLSDEVVEKVDELAEANVSSVALARASATAYATRSERAGGTERGPTTGNAVAGGSDTQINLGTGPGVPPGIGTGSTATEDPTPVTVDGEPADAPTIVLGASTGGPKIVERLFERLPAELGAKLLVVQHMPPGFTERFADRLDSHSAYDVREATDRDRLRPGEAAVAPGNVHLEVAAEIGDSLRLRLTDGDRVHGVRPAIDVTMESAAKRVSNGLCGVVLTGMGRDGAAGIEAIKGVGGHTIAQDEATSPVFGIPCQAIETGCVDTIAPAEGIIDAIVDAFTTDGENDE